MNDNNLNPFGSSTLPAQSRQSAVANTDQHRAIAEVQAAMMIARTNPRDPIAAMDRILNACSRPSLAEAAVYQFGRGGSDVTGPSIRLAEAMAQQWGNIKTSVRELDQSNGVSTVQTIAWDLETGYQCDKVFHVPHIRYTKSGSKALTDPRDIYELVANNGARRLRACILAVIPGDVTEAAVRQCEMTMHAKADTSPEALQKMVEAFAAYGVTKDQIEKRIQRRLDAIQPAQVVGLKKVYASLRDGMSAAADWFESSDQANTDNSTAKSTSRTDAVKDKIRTKQAPNKIDDLDQKQDDELRAIEGAPVVTFAQVADKLNAAPDVDLLDAAADLIGEVADEPLRNELGDIYHARREVLGE